MAAETCNSKVGLDFLAEGMAKQYDDYQSALQELLDNAVSGTVKSKDYFESPNDSVFIEVAITRDEDTVRTIVADNGPGISRQALRDEVFQTGNKSVSDGILNNVGWGLKASLSWFESTLNSPGSDDNWFELLTRTDEGELVEVDGPITGELPIVGSSDDRWTEGLSDPETRLDENLSGTRVHVSCSREQFDDDLWPTGKKLDLKVQALRERLGLLFRRLLDARDDNRIVISYEDKETGATGSYKVIPIFPKYKEPENDEEYGYFEFTVEDEDENIFEVTYEKGTLDYRAMREEYESEAPGLFTSGGNFRTRYRPSQAKQGIDVYGNGRVLMTSVFSELFNLTRNNQYNYFGGSLRIIPQDPSVEIPTDNKKTQIDTSSTLWANIRGKLSSKPYLPVGKSYYDEPSVEDEANEEQAGTEDHIPNDSSDAVPSIDLSEKSLYGIHNADSRRIKDHLRTLNDGCLPEEGLVDLTITSPPYADIKNYATNPEAQVGFGDSYQNYLAELRDIFSKIYEVTKEDGSLWLVANTFKKNGQVYNLPWDLASQLQNLDEDRVCPECSTEKKRVPLVQGTSTGPYQCLNCEYSTSTSGSWTLQEIVIWDKQRALPYSGQGKLRNVFEYILFFTKSPDFTFDLDSVRIADPSKFKDWWVDYPERYHPRGKVPSNIWEMVTPSQGSFGFESLNHPAPFPPKMVERMLQLTSKESDVVLDPFAGSGMVLAMAEMLDRKPIGFELSEQYCENYSAVRNEVMEKEEAETFIYSKEQQDQLARIIAGLRQTKQIQRILAHLAEEQNIENPVELNVQAVFHLSKTIDESVSDSGNFINAEYLFVVDEGTTPAQGAELKSMIESIVRETDARNFGIRVSAKVVTMADLVSEYKQGIYPEFKGKLFRYEKKHHAFVDTITFDDWQGENNQYSPDSANIRFPPIISNIGLNVLNPRDSNDEKRTEEAGTHRMVQGAGTKVSEVASVQENVSSSAD